MSVSINNRVEFLFIYDTSFANPNGDPANNNECRIDEEINRLIVTPERIKRTVRDYMYNFKGYNQDEPTEGNKYLKTIYVKRIINKKGNVMKNKDRQEDIISKTKQENDDVKEILFIKNDIIDIRWFGGVFTSKKEDNTENFHITGPIQIDYGISMHSADCRYIKGTSAFAASEGKSSGTFRDSFITPYAVIAVYGSINEVLAKQTNLTDSDVELFFEAMWYGTMNLKTSSKSQMPRFLLKIKHKKNDNCKFVFLGKDLVDLLKIKYKDNKDDYSIRSVKDYKIDAKDLIEYLNKQKCIESVSYRKHDFFDIDISDSWEFLH